MMTSHCFFRTIKTVCMIPLLAQIALAADAPDQPIASVNWGQLKDKGELTSGEVIRGNEGTPDRLKIVHPKTGSHSIPLCEINAPPIKTASYALRGTIRYQNVSGIGYLEMWSHFPDGGEYFTRTIATNGAMQTITGTSPEREFLLPFHTLGKSPAPTKLVVNLVLNGPGELEIGPIELIPIATMATTTATDWWSGSTGGLIGGIGGALLGLIGALIGALARYGKGKKVVLTLSAILAAAGAMILIVGICALFVGQSYNVYYPLLLIGALSGTCGASLLAILPGRFRLQELRRMQAMDLA